MYFLRNTTFSRIEQSALHYLHHYSQFYYSAIVLINAVVVAPQCYTLQTALLL